MEQSTLRPNSSSQREALKEAVEAYETALTVDAARYLAERGIDRNLNATIARLGVVVDPRPGHEKYRGFVSIPYFNLHGDPVDMRFRCIEKHEHHGHGKYMSISGSHSRVYNAPALKWAGDTIHVAEGEFDALVLTKLGLPAISLPGAQNWNGRFRTHLEGFSRIWVWGDPDEAGAEMVNKICNSLGNARGVRLREGDVSDTYLKHGPEALLELIEERK